jgi:hypothetical protein
MKLVKSKIILASTMIFAIIGCFIFYFFYGLPWDFISYKNKFDVYLEDKYNKEFMVEEISFNFFHGKTYQAYAYAKESPDLTFYVGQNRITREIEDSYHYETWQKQAKEELSPIVEEIFPDHFSYAVQIYPLNNLSISEESQILNYKGYSTVDIGVSMDDVDITKENRESEIERAYLLLVSIKEKGIRFNHFGISYKNKTIQLQPDKIRSISDANDLDRWLKDYK